jgi:hypothetical protein
MEKGTVTIRIGDLAPGALVRLADGTFGVVLEPYGRRDGPRD